jgi:hypothetical protein
MSERIMDALGRVHSEVLGWDRKIEIPAGSRILLEAEKFGGVERLRLTRWAVGREAVVLSNFTHTSRSGIFEEAKVEVRFVTPTNQWELYQNYISWDRRYVKVLAVGNDKPKPGIDYELTQREIWDERFKEMNHAHQGYVNITTFMAAIALITDRQHYRAITGMLRVDGTINPERLKNYWRKSVSAEIRGALVWYPPAFPERSNYRYSINWSEIANDFAERAKEQLAA